MLMGASVIMIIDFNELLWYFQHFFKRFDFNLRKKHNFPQMLALTGTKDIIDI